MKNFFKKSMLLILVLTCFSMVASATDIYARIEIENYSHLVYGPYYDQWDEGTGDLVVRFYSDAACTTPYTLTAPLTVYIKSSFEESYNYTLTGWGDTGEWTVTASAGDNHISAGDGYALFQHHTTSWPTTYYPGENDNDNIFIVESPGDGSYTEEATVKNY
ncbi:hypothetical protein BDD43_0007 [Mucilaginibacter gracilis]|uniref:Uncharacterized protein n=1 Tax=Mucilaginibacter gracilis TaxID=423350 RepID=A0A495IUE3_9SPHI|nr:hypothetical protein [Mucilaginibacter gracilis]RKR79921.1 hypothetical protein BDD43_0007 [Mucilaginibacter gracilis]